MVAHSNLAPVSLSTAATDSALPAGEAAQTLPSPEAGGVPSRARFYHSITFRNLAIFLPVLLLALSPLTYTYWRDSRAGRIENLATRLELIAEQSARRIDPALVAGVTRRGQTGAPEHRRLVSLLEGIQRDFAVDNAVLLRRVAGGSFRYIADGSDQFFVTQPVFIHEQFPETLRAARAAWENQGGRHSELFGFGTYEYLQFNKPIADPAGNVVALLLINQFAEDVDQAIRMDTVRLLTLALAIAVLGAAVFWLFSTRLLHPLVRLKEAANRVATGDLDVEIAHRPGGDEVSLLNESFRTMVREVCRGRAALQRNNDELKRTLARVRLMEDLEKNLFKFVPREVGRALHSDPEALERGKTQMDVTVLFLDVEGSTQLTESMEPARIDHLIEEYFSRYLDFIYENQGDITETAGDGLMIIFQGGDPAGHALNAVRTALEIQRATRAICGVRDRPGECLAVNIGISSGPALVGFTKYEAISGSRVTFTASGRTTILAARLQDMAKGGGVLLSEETWRRVAGRPELAGLWGNSRDLGPQRLKNMAEPARVYQLELAEA